MTELSLVIYKRNWEIARKSYPGWIVSPSKNRQQLERLRPIEDQNNSLQVEGALRILSREWSSENPSEWSGIASIEDKLAFIEVLNWVLEVQLHPLYDPLPRICENLLVSVNPFGKVDKDINIFNENATEVFANTQSHNSVYENWVKLALSLLRQYREENDFSNWHKWKEVLSATLSKSDDKAFVKYETCLFHLSKWQYDKIQKELDDWPEDVRDPYWLTRKAIVYGQIGQFPQKQNLFEHVLKRLGELEVVPAQPFYIISREIWTRYFYANSVAWDERVKHGDRLSSLKSDKYDPYLEINYFRDKFSAKEKRHIEEFDPHTIKSESVSLGGWDYDKYYKLFRFCDVLGIPGVMQNEDIFNINMSIELREKAALGLQEVDKTRSRWELFACENMEVIQSFLTRSNVTLLEDYFIQFWWDSCLNVYNQERKMQSRKDQNLKRFALSMEVLSRLSLRREKGEIIDFLKQLFADWDAGTFHFFNGPRKAYANLLKRLIEMLEVSDLQPVLHLIFNFPKADAREPDWPEPVSYIPWKGELKRDQKIRAIVSSLLERCKGKNKNAPLNELIWFMERGCLLELEKTKLTNFVWQNKDEPFYPGLMFPAILRLPEKKEGQAKEWVIKTILNAEIPNLKTGNSHVFGEERAWGVWFYQIYQSSKLHRDYDTNFIEECLIDWNEEQACKILEKTIAWWSKNEETIKNRLAQTFLIDRGVEEYINIIAMVLSEIIAPRLISKLNAQKSIVKLCSLMKLVGVKTKPLEVALLRFNKDQAQKIANELREGIFSSDRKIVENTASALKAWKSQQGINKMPEMPVDFIDFLSIRLASLPQSEQAKTSLEVLTHLLDTSTVTNLKHVNTAMGVMRKAAQYQKKQMGELHTIRWWCVKLASVVNTIPQHNAPEVEEWLKEASKDPLPEIRALVS